MKGEYSVWFKVIASVAFLVVAAFSMSWIFGNFFAALGGSAKCQDASLFYKLGSTFGVFFVGLVGIGAVLVPLEMLGIGRFYDRRAEDVKEQRLLARTLLLVFMSIFSIGSVASLGMIVAYLTE